MVVRIRLAGSDARHNRFRRRRLLLAAAALLQPAAVMAGVLAFWRFGSDLGWTQQFAISGGFFSHWQVWIAILLLCEGMAILLNRWARRRPKPVQEPAEDADPSMANSRT